MIGIPIAGLGSRAKTVGVLLFFLLSLLNPSNLLAQDTAVSTDDTGNVVATTTLADSGSTADSPLPPPLSTTAYTTTLSTSPLSTPTPEPDPNRTETSAVVDENGNTIEATITYRDDIRRKKTEKTFDADGNLIKRVREKYTNDGEIRSQSITVWDVEGDRISRDRFYFRYLKDTDALIAEAIEVLGDSVASGITTLAEANVEGSSDTTQFFAADGDLLGQMVSGEPDTWYSMDNKTGELVPIQPFGLPEGALAAIADYLNIDPSNITNVTYIQDADAVFCMGTGCASWRGSLEVTATINGEEKHFIGTITGGFFDQSERAPEVTLEKSALELPAYKSETHAIMLATSQFPDVDPETIQVIETQALSEEDLADETILPENFVGVHLVTLQIGKGGPTLTYIGGYDSETLESLAIATQATLDYLEQAEKGLADLPVGTLEVIASYLNIDAASIINVTYTPDEDAVFCMGTGCASWRGSLEVTATINGEEKHFIGTITGGFFAQPDRAPEVILEKPAFELPAYKSENHAIVLATSQFPDVDPETIQVIETQALSEGDLADETILPENFVGVHLVTLQIGKGGPTLTYIGGYDTETLESLAIATQATLDYLEQAEKGLADLPVGTLEVIADYLNIDVSNITSVTYTQNEDAIFCMGTGCASWTGSLEVTATIGGEEKHFIGTITGGFFAQPDRAPEVSLQEASL